MGKMPSLLYIIFRHKLHNHHSLTHIIRIILFVHTQLSLEDWFYVGDNGAVEVASPDDAIAAACLPPLHLDSSTGPRWNSETGE